MCLQAPGGYCASTCGATGTACDGTCVATARDGELCMQSCARDADCRADEGYLCDPQWRACIVPNSATLVVNRCPAPAGPARDLAFAQSTQLSTAATPGLYQLDPAAVVMPTGAVVALFGSRGVLGASHGLGLARVGTAATVIDGAFVPPVGEAAADGMPVAGGRIDPALARDAKGTLYAAWLAAGDETGSRVLLARSTDAGATWSKAMPVSAAGDCTGDRDCPGRPILAIGGGPGAKGTQILYVIYGAAGGLRVRASRDGGASLSPPVTALEGAHADASVGHDGRLHLVALAAGPSTGGFGSAGHRIAYAVSADGGRSFTRPQRLGGRDDMLPFYFATPSIAIDSKRKWIYVAYVRGGRDAVWDLIVLASKDNGATWKRTRIGDTPGCAIHMVPNLVVDPTTGALHLAWYDGLGTGRFAHARCAPGLASCTQLGAINDRPFPALTTARNAPAWIGERANLAIDDKRRTLHAVWTQPISEGGMTTSRIFHAAAKLPRR